ncbi:TRAP transporter small permease [Arenibaculum pallidiluteum]|uniref:TRAP transporter small permease n=1 Tax=Arenibaculum pallidiluteum TaxID=2812559 RepID=UPI001A95DF81|nr:TRAP transporter small permease [Arenibaculum pallidiluteum]
MRETANRAAEGTGSGVGAMAPASTPGPLPTALDIPLDARLEDERDHSVAIEDIPAFIVFWALAFVVFLQFFTRYVLNDSFTWTEEGARYLLIATAFLGGAMAVRRRSHIMVEFFHNYLPPRLSAVVLSVCDVVTVGFYAYSAWLAWRLTQAMKFQPMSVIDLPMSLLYWVVLAGLVLMALRAVQSAWRRVAAFPA